MSSKTMHKRWRGLIVIGALFVAACGGNGDAEPDATVDDDDATEDVADDDGDDAAADAGSIAANYDLSGLEVTVGSKEFTEQLILGQVAIQALEAAGADVTDETGLVGTATVRGALESGDIDLYWEYTGTGWVTNLGNTEAIDDPIEQFEAVAAQDLEENGIVWLQPALFNNTYAFAVGPETAEELGIDSLSELPAFMEANPDQATLCAAAEFITRDDGLPGVQQHYGFEFEDRGIVEMELGLVYPTVASGEECTFGEVFATDGRIAALDLHIIEDDEEFFASFLPAVNVREEIVDQDDSIADLFAEIADVLDEDTMRGLNASVDVDGGQPADVARDFLVANGFLAG